jgi:hypothetical protein
VGNGAAYSTIGGNVSNAVNWINRHRNSAHYII